MDALNHADQMRLANLINDGADDVELQRKLDQVVELTSSSRDHAAVALHDSNYDVEKAVDMILEGAHVIESQWKSAGKKKNKQQAQLKAAAAHGQVGTLDAANQSRGAGNATQKISGNIKQSSSTSNHAHAVQNSGPLVASGEGNIKPAKSLTQQHQQQFKAGQHGQKITSNTTNQPITSNDQQNDDAPDNLKSLIGVPSENLLQHSDLIKASPASATANSQQASRHPVKNQRGLNQQSNAGPLTINQYNKDASESLKNLIGIPSSNPVALRDTCDNSTNSKMSHQQSNLGSKGGKSSRIPESAVEMPANKQQLFSLNVQFGELDLGDAASANSQGDKGPSQQARTKVSGRGRNTTAYSSGSLNQDSRNTRQPLNKGPRRQNANDDKRFNRDVNSNRGRQMPSQNRSFNQLSSQSSRDPVTGPRGARIVTNNRNIQPGQNVSSNDSRQPTGGFPNSIDLWTNSTAEAPAKTRNDSSINDPSVIQSATATRVGQWSDVAGNENWNEEDWDAKVMETKVFNQTSKDADRTQSVQKIKLPEPKRENLHPQQNVQNVVSDRIQLPPASQISQMNDIFDESVARAVLAQQFQQLNRPLTSTSSVSPTTNSTIAQKAGSGLKDIESNKSIPSVPPGALPVMSQPQYIMSNAFQPAIFPYPYQAADVHYQVAAHNAGREQNYQSVYSPSDANKFNRGAEGDTSSISTTQSHPFVANPMHGYQLTYAMPQAYNMMPQNLYSAAHIFPHMAQPTNAGSANNVYPKNSGGSYQPHTGYSSYDQLNPLIQDYVKQQNYTGSNMQQHSPNKSAETNSDLDTSSAVNSSHVYGVTSKFQQPSTKPINFRESKSYQQQMSGNGQQFGFSHSAQQQSSAYPLLHGNNQESSNLNSSQPGQHSLQHAGSSQKSSSTQVNAAKYNYPSWN